MIDALIDDGDTVLMQQAASADDGEMVALWIKDRQEVTLKRVFREADRLRLQPANRQMQPIYQRPDNVEIQGKLIGVIRKVQQQT
jgi:repressor LexA